MARNPTRLPSGLNEEDPFLVVSDFSLSLRKVLTLVFGGIVWWAAAWLVGLVLGGLVAWIITFPVMIGAAVLGFVNRGGRPLEHWMVDKILFRISPRQYTLHDPTATRSERVIDASFDDDGDEWHGI